MANLFSTSIRPRSLTFHTFNFPNPSPKSKRRLNFGLFPFKPRPSARISASRGGDELDIVSISECADGSVVFRFGDVKEIEEERARIAAAEGLKECEEIGVVDDETDSVADGFVESGSLVMGRIDVVEESVGVSVSEAAEGENGGGLELSEAMLEGSLHLEEGFVHKGGVKVDDVVECEALLIDSVGLEKGFVDKNSVNGGGVGGGLKLSETLLNDTLGLGTGIVDKENVNSTEEVEGESDRRLVLSETLLEEIVLVEEGSGMTGDVVEGESDRVLDLSETLLGESGDFTHVENTVGDVVEGESDCSLELNEAFQEASAKIEEFYVEIIGSGSDRLSESSETLPEVNVNMAESYVESIASGSDVVEGVARDRALELSETMLEASIDVEESRVEITGSNVTEGGESDCALELSETMPEASLGIEEGRVVMEMPGALENNLKLEELLAEDENEEVAELHDIVEVESNVVLNRNYESNVEDDGVSTSTLASNLDTVNQEVKGDKFVTRLASLEPRDATGMHDSDESVGKVKENAIVEVPKHSGVNVNINVEAQVNNLSAEHTGASHLIEVMPISDTLEAKPIIDEPVETEEITSLEMLDASALSSNSVETIAKDGAQSTNIAEESIHNPLELQPASLIREEVSTTGLFLSSGAALFPVASKALTGREDAYLVASQDWLGVADGVSEWSLEGINVGSYARELMENCEKIVSDSESVQITNPVEVLSRSVSDTESHGSSTALVAFFNSQVLRVANIGDSGFIIVRNETVFKSSSPMVHGINFPIHIQKGDDPSELVEEYEIDLSEDDIIVIATDGLFDNLYEEEIASIASKSVQAGLEPQEIAELLAARALEVGSSASSTSPFAEAVQAAGYGGYTGGKLDDVAVIVSLVQKRKQDSVVKQV